MVERLRTRCSWEKYRELKQALDLAHAHLIEELFDIHDIELIPDDIAERMDLYMDKLETMKPLEPNDEDEFQQAVEVNQNERADNQMNHDVASTNNESVNTNNSNINNPSEFDIRLAALQRKETMHSKRVKATDLPIFDGNPTQWHDVIKRF